MYYEATLKPMGAGALSPGLEMFRGEKVILIKGWRADAGPHLGHQFYITTPYFGSIPEGELKDMRQISYPEWKRKKSSLEKRKDLRKYLNP